jgi:hypothetical protein
LQKTLSNEVTYIYIPILRCAHLATQKWGSSSAPPNVVAVSSSKTGASKAAVSSSKTDVSHRCWPKLVQDLSTQSRCELIQDRRRPPPLARAHPSTQGRHELIQDCCRLELSPPPHGLCSSKTGAPPPPTCARPRPSPLAQAHCFLVARWRWMFETTDFASDLVL